MTVMNAILGILAVAWIGTAAGLVALWPTLVAAIRGEVR